MTYINYDVVYIIMSSHQSYEHDLITDFKFFVKVSFSHSSKRQLIE